MDENAYIHYFLVFSSNICVKIKELNVLVTEKS